MTAHNYHLVDRSKWPVIISINLMCTLISLILQMQYYSKGYLLFNTSFIMVIIIFITWTRDIIREGTMIGLHTNKVIKGLLLGIVLFIISETMVFFAIFWGYLHNSLLPAVQIGYNWPSNNIQSIDPYEIPLLNTLILLTAGSTCTVTHHYITSNKQYKDKCLLLTIILIAIFITLQYIEYRNTNFDISDSVFASVFYGGTTIHGLHVLVAGLWLSYIAYRINRNHQWKNHHVNLLTGLWYFHFTDIVWLVLYTLYYLWTV